MKLYSLRLKFLFRLLKSHRNAWYVAGMYHL
jgi:hypothetical protein